MGDFQLDNAAPADSEGATGDNRTAEADSSTEDIFSEIGFGLWNVPYILAICLCQASAPTQKLLSIFTNMPKNFRCNYTYTHQQNTSNFDNLCAIHSISMERYELMNNVSDGNSQSCTEFDHNISIYESTFTTEFDLVCDDAWLSSLYQMILVIGLIIGNFANGLSDYFGRVNILRVSSTFYVIGVLLVGFGPKAFIVLSGRLIIGICFPIVNGASYTLVLETVAPQHRSAIGILVFLPYYINTIIMGCLAYYIRMWRQLHLLISAPVYIIPLVSIWMSPSPRWLIQQNRLDEAHTVLEKAASINHGTAPSKYNVQNINSQINLKTVNERSLKCKLLCSPIYSLQWLLKLLFASVAMTKISIILPLIWLFGGVVYFGVPLNANSFTNNPFVYIVILGIAELPSVLIGPFIIKRFGNINTSIFVFIGTGLCMLGILVVPSYIWWLKWILVMLSMAMIGLGVGICFILVSELFPTVVRTSAFGLCFLLFYLGFLLCSYINSTIANKVGWLFNVVCGVSCLLAALLVALLPETQGQPLCETIEDVNTRQHRPVRNSQNVAGTCNTAATELCNSVTYIKVIHISSPYSKNY